MPLYRGSRRIIMTRRAADAPQTTAFLARTSGLSGTETAAYKALINGLVTDGVFSLLDALYIFATNTTTTANLNLISTSFGLTQTGSVTFSADHGYTGDGSTGYLDTGYTPSTAGGHLTLNSVSGGAYILNSRATANNHCAFGTGDNAFIDKLNYQPLNNSNNALAQGNDASNANFALSITNAQGMGSVTRNSSSTLDFYKNAGSTLGPASATSQALAVNSILICAGRETGTPSNFSADQIAAVYFGGGLNATQVGQVHSRINAYMTALGIAVY